MVPSGRRVVVPAPTGTGLGDGLGDGVGLGTGEGVTEGRGLGRVDTVGSGDFVVDGAFTWAVTVWTPLLFTIGSQPKRKIATHARVEIFLSMTNTPIYKTPQISLFYCVLRIEWNVSIMTRPSSWSRTRMTSYPRLNDR